MQLMKNKLIYSVLCMVALFLGQAKALVAQGFDKESFYSAMASGNMEQINDELVVVRAASFHEKDAYEGALLMRKSGLLKKAQEKLNAFKAGRIKFETALQDDGDNAEYRFLRLTIQEHAPRVVKYYHEIEKDSQFIKKAYKNLSPVVQKAILDYSKTSKVLRPEDL
ncbi:MAG: hypothetical protein JWQ30_772 [Sediminibacterium sp.]|nr:hypothetical protein [Sediminibacterium sp.]